MDNTYKSPPSPGKAPKAGSSQSASGAGVKSGLSEQTGINVNPSANGMDTVGVDQKPQATPKESVSKNGNSFDIC